MGSPGVDGPDEPPAGTRVSPWRRGVRIVWLVAFLAAVGWALYDRREEVVEGLAGMPVVGGIVALVGALIGVGVQGLVWRALVAGLATDLSLVASARLFFAAQLGKYLPGGVWPVLAQADLASDHGMPPRLVFAVFVLTTWVHLATGVLVAAVLLPASGVLAWQWGLLAVPALAALVPALLRRGIDSGLRLLRRASLPPLQARAILLAVVGSLVMWAAFGAHLAGLLGGAVDQRVLVGTGVFAASWAAGLLVLPAPAGAGVREAVVVLLLPGLAPGVALAVAVLSRGLLVVADLLWALVGLLAGRRARQ